MRKLSRRLFSVIFIILLFVSTGAVSEELSEIGFMKAFEEISMLTELTMELRSQKDTLEVIDFLETVNDLQKEFEKYMVLMAVIDPPQTLRRFAIHVLIGAKEVELSLWYYLLASLETQPDYIEEADELLNSGFRQLRIATELLQEPAP